MTALRRLLDRGVNLACFLLAGVAGGLFFGCQDRMGIKKSPAFMLIGFLYFLLLVFFGGGSSILLVRVFFGFHCAFLCLGNSFECLISSVCALLWLGDPEHILFATLMVFYKINKGFQ